MAVDEALTAAQERGGLDHGRSWKSTSTLTPGEQVFRGVDRWDAGEHHRERLKALGLEGYRLHDARHHWAVRMARRRPLRKVMFCRSTAAFLTRAAPGADVGTGVPPSACHVALALMSATR